MVQAVADVHATPFSVLFGAAGVVWIVQLVPFQTSASVPRPPCPTAVQAVAEAHETAESVFSPPGTGLGVVWIVQLMPFQNSANVVWELLLPTAVQAVADVHETPFSALDGLRFGVLWIVQLVPFQNSASVTWVPSLLMKSPTAVQAVAPAHETAVSCPAPAGLGVG
ncbi:MAG: hypothetical protein ACJ780_02860 [Solirubrobacteraceae bacterium]